MTPHVDIALREFEDAMEAWAQAEEPPRGFPLTEWHAFKAALVMDASDRAECRVGSEMKGFPGSLWRFVAQCDYRRVTPWHRGERLREIPQGCIFDVAGAAVASIVLQMVAPLTRKHMKPAALDILEHAKKLLLDDIDVLSEHKKADAVLRRNLRVVPSE